MLALIVVERGGEMGIALKKSRLVAVVMSLVVILSLLFPTITFAAYHTAGTKVFRAHHYFTYSECKRIVRNCDGATELTNGIAAASGLVKSYAARIVGFSAYLYGRHAQQLSYPFRHAVSKHKGVYIKYTYYLPPMGPGTYENYGVYYK